MGGGLTINGFTFGEVTTEAEDVFGTAPFDGILGMGVPKAAVDKTPMPMDMLVQQKKIEKNQFAFYLSSGGKSGSTLTLGGTRSSLHWPRRRRTWLLFEQPLEGHLFRLTDEHNRAQDLENFWFRSSFWDVAI